MFACNFVIVILDDIALLSLQFITLHPLRVFETLFEKSVAFEGV